MAIPLKGGSWIQKVLPLHQWRRKEGLSSFLTDMITLRHSLALCTGCERKMPRRWTERYNYEFVKGFYAEQTACDYCRALTSANMYCPVDGAYHQEMVKMRTMINEVQARERRMWDQDRKFLVGY